MQSRSVDQCIQSTRASLAYLNQRRDAIELVGVAADPVSSRNVFGRHLPYPAQCTQSIAVALSTYVQFKSEGLSGGGLQREQTLQRVCGSEA